ncbi:MAG: ATP synthase F1 subunit gamma [Bryobacteraceae bacterium]
MPSLIDLRRRIRSIKNTQQITKAMKMVSAAKLRRAQDRVIAARPYAATLQKMLANVITAAADNEEAAASPLLANRPENRIQLLLLTSDSGLAGAFNSNVIKGAQKFLAAHPNAKVEFEVLGRKGRDFFRKRNAVISGEYLGIFKKPVYTDAADIAKKVVARLQNDEIDAVYLVYNEFKSVMSQTIISKRILPVEPPSGGERIDYIFEQSPVELLASMLPRYAEIQLFTAIMESAAAEHAARMTAMDAASSNASDVIDRLTLFMNRVRQASITREIIEVVSGASSLE